MPKRLFGMVATLTAVAAVFPTISGAAAPSPYTVSCLTGGNTSVDWKHTKLSQVTITWSAPSGSAVTFAPLVEPVLSLTPPHGLIVAQTPSSGGVQPVSATATFQHTDGSTDQATSACS